VQRGEQAGVPRCTGRERLHSRTDTQDGNGARLENGFVVLATSGRIAVRWSRRVAGPPKTGTLAGEADGW
jgi:hypothetical protein